MYRRSDLPHPTKVDCFVCQSHEADLAKAISFLFSLQRLFHLLGEDIGGERLRKEVQFLVKYAVVGDDVFLSLV
jgi:hypothetical protein